MWESLRQGTALCSAAQLARGHKHGILSPTDLGTQLSGKSPRFMSLIPGLFASQTN